MKKFDLTKEYGIVLEGGGAKGAYQIGVWMAMQECGVKIKGISGVSVGALNGALMVIGDTKRAIDLWRNICYSQVMNVDDMQMEQLFRLKLRELDLGQLVKFGIKLITDRGLDVTPLRSLIEEYVDEEKIRSSDIELVLGTFSVDSFHQLEITADKAEPGYLKDYLLASAYFPAFRNERLHGRKYIDGGIIDNVPIGTLLQRDYKDIIVIRIFGLGINKPVKIPSDVTVTEIAPRVALGNLLDFNTEKSRRNITIGYFDGMRTFRSLAGKIYYIDSKLSEEECMLRLLHCNRAVKMALLEYYGQNYEIPFLYARGMLEKVFPEMADGLKLGREWFYQELYIALLELCAKNLRVQKYKIYTEDELLKNVNSRYTQFLLLNRERHFPLFIELVCKMMTLPSEKE